MQRFNFNQLGGFPLTQDRLKWMQDGYIDAINALGSVVDSEEPVVLSGVELVAGGWVHGEVSDGWVYHPDAGVVPFIGGVFTANNRSYYLTDEITSLTFANNTNNGVQIKRCMKLSAGSAPSIRSLSERRFKTELFKWSDWEEILGADTSLTNNAKLEYRSNPHLRKVDVRGVLTVQPVLSATPQFIEVKPFKNLPFALKSGRSVEAVGKVFSAGSPYAFAFGSNAFSTVLISLVAHGFNINNTSSFNPDGVHIVVTTPPPESPIQVRFDFTFNY